VLWKTPIDLGDRISAICFPLEGRYQFLVLAAECSKSPCALEIRKLVGKESALRALEGDCRVLKGASLCVARGPMWLMHSIPLALNNAMPAGVESDSNETVIIDN